MIFLSASAAFNRVGLLAAATGLALNPLPGAAQDYPNKPIRMMVPQSAGTASDFFARIVGTSLSEKYGQQIVIDNRPGAGGLISSTILAKATPDGYVLGVVGQAHVVPPLLLSKPPYRVVEDFSAIAQVASVPNVLVVGPNVVAKNISELIAYCKANPGKLNFASVGVGTAGHMAAEIVNRAADIKVVHVPHKILADVLPGMMQGLVHYYVFTLPAALPMLHDGRLRALAVTTPKRSTMLPNVPTIAEAGLPAAQSDSWFGIAAPAGTPLKLITRLSNDIVEILRRPETKDQFERQGAEPTVETTPAVFVQLLKSEYVRYQQLIKDIGVKPQ